MPVSPGRTVARLVAIVATCLAVADGFRWGNRWYVSTMFGSSGEADIAGDILAKAHGALLQGLGWLALAILAATVGWQLRLRVVRSAPA